MKSPQQRNMPIVSYGARVPAASPYVSMTAVRDMSASRYRLCHLDTGQSQLNQPTTRDHISVLLPCLRISHDKPLRAYREMLSGIE